MNEYRCTRRDPYHPNSSGAKDISNRQGYYLHANSAKAAYKLMQGHFPSDTAGFDIQLWKRGMEYVGSPLPEVVTL